MKKIKYWIQDNFMHYEKKHGEFGHYAWTFDKTVYLVIILLILIPTIAILCWKYEPIKLLKKSLE